MRAGMPGSLSVWFVMGRPWRNSITVAPLSGKWWSTAGPMPSPAATRALWSSLARSMARRSVEAPGIRTTNACPSTSTR